MHTRNATASIIVLLAAFGTVIAADGNRLAYLDEPLDPYYVHRGFPKLITPQWVGEEGVEAVVVLAIDDMRDPAKYEAYLRPILDRLKKIDGRAPVSIMTCSVNPQDPQLHSWLKEGLSIECHTIDHPCPLLQGGDLAKAKSTYDRCVDLMNQIPGKRPVAFRMPCCDSKNTPSPRFWTEIFNKTTEQGNFLSIDSSVFCILTSKDKELPRELVTDADGGERFRKYLPFPSFVNTIEDYPYPYVIGRQCWEFPCIVPSDWEAQYLHKPNNPRTVADLKAALDAVVLKQGVFNLVFHPHGWIRSEQIVEMIDHAAEKHGTKVKFLTFSESKARLTKNLLGGHSLRSNNGADNGVRLLDVNNDGYVDVIVANSGVRHTRLWKPQAQSWSVSDFPVPVTSAKTESNQPILPNANACFGVLDDDGRAALVVDTGKALDAWHFQDGRWERLVNQPQQKHPVHVQARGYRLRDVDGDGRCELMHANFVKSWSHQGPNGGIVWLGPGVVSMVYHWETKELTWKSAYGIPFGLYFMDEDRIDGGLRLVDVDADGRLDLLFSGSVGYSLHLFKSNEDGWATRAIEGRRNQTEGLGPVIPMIVRPDGTNNGVWFHSGHMWVQNEDTDRLPDGVDRLSFEEMLKEHRQK